MKQEKTKEVQVVEIWLKGHYLPSSPVLKAACIVDFNYNERRLVLKNITSAGNPRGHHLLPASGELVINFPPDREYELHIGKVVHHLLKLVEE